MPFLPYDDAKQQQMKQQDQRLTIKIIEERNQQTQIKIERLGDQWRPRYKKMQCEKCFHADIQTNQLLHKKVLVIWCKINHTIIQHPFKLCPHRLEKPKTTFDQFLKPKETERL